MRQVLWGRETGKDVHIFGHHGGKGGCGVRDELERRLFQCWSIAPVIVVTGQCNPVALYPFPKGERTSADWLLLDVFDAFGRDDHCVTPCHVEQEVPVRAFKRDLDRCRVHHVDGSNPGKQTLLRVCGFFSPCAVQREFHILCIHCGAVVEGHAAAQLEGIDRAIVADFPTFGETGDNRPIAHEACQPFEHIGVKHGVNCLRGGGSRVQMWRFQLHGDGDVAFRISGKATERQRGCQRNPGYEMSHGWSPLSLSGFLPAITKSVLGNASGIKGRLWQNFPDGPHRSSKFCLRDPVKTKSRRFGLIRSATQQRSPQHVTGSRQHPAGQKFRPSPDPTMRRDSRISALTERPSARR